MTEYFLHVGLHKTGTTFLQETVFPRVQDITFVSRPYTQYNRAFNALQYADDSVYEAEAIRAELDRIPGRRVLLSDEGFSGKPLALNYVNRTMVAKRLQQAMPDATVILFLRGQVDIILSLYNQYVRMGGAKDLVHTLWRSEGDFPYERYLEEGSGFYDPYLLHYNTSDTFIHLDSFRYAPLVRAYLGLFRRVAVFLYEDLATRPERVAEGFRQLFGHESFEPAGEALCAGPRVNVSVPDADLRQARFVNRVRRLTSCRVVVAAAERLYRTGRHAVTAAAPYRELVQERVGDYYRADNRQLAAECPGLGLADYPEHYLV